MKPPELDHMTVAEVSRVLRISPASTYRYISEGRLPAIRVGPRTLRVPRVAFRLWLKGMVEIALRSMERGTEQVNIDRSVGKPASE
jgi:excisionase family DNA binding protein